MTLTPLYIPKLADSSIPIRAIVIVALAIALVVYARQRWGTAHATAFVVGGWVAAVVPSIVVALSEDLGGYGDWCREVNHSTLPDGCFAVFAYFDVGWGTPASVAGLVCGWLLLEGLGWISSRFVRQRTAR